MSEAECWLTIESLLETFALSTPIIHIIKNDKTVFLRICKEHLRLVKLYIHRVSFNAADELGKIIVTAFEAGDWDYLVGPLLNLGQAFNINAVVKEPIEYFAKMLCASIKNKNERIAKVLLNTTEFKNAITVHSGLFKKYGCEVFHLLLEDTTVGGYISKEALEVMDVIVQLLGNFPILLGNLLNHRNSKGLTPLEFAQNNQESKAEKILLRALDRVREMEKVVPALQFIPPPKSPRESKAGDSKDQIEKDVAVTSPAPQNT